MFAFIIKSTVCMAVFYGFYYFLLRNAKIPVFNRFYLLFALAFSLIIPFITIRISTNIPISHSIQQFTSATGIFIQGENLTREPEGKWSIQIILIFLYLTGTITFLLRFVLNISKLFRKIQTSVVVENLRTKIVLIEAKTLPYSFFKYIFVNKTDFENGEIDKKLIVHEQAHCSQYHSVDILILELVKIILWFNPFIWLLGRAIQLNHEFLADHNVLSNCDLSEYQHTLLNLVFRNNSTYLASNFNYSLTKKRLIMMTKNNSKSTIYRIAVTPIIVASLMYFISCNKDVKDVISVSGNENAWWAQILSKHNIELPTSNINGDLLYISKSFSVNNKITTYTDAIFVIKSNNGYSYYLKTPLAYQNLNSNTIEGEEAIFEMYKYGTEIGNPFRAYSLKKFKFQFHNDKTKYDWWDAKEIN